MYSRHATAAVRAVKAVCRSPRTALSAVGCPLHGASRRSETGSCFSQKSRKATHRYVSASGARRPCRGMRCGSAASTEGQVTAVRLELQLFFSAAHRRTATDRPTRARARAGTLDRLVRGIPRGPQCRARPVGLCRRMPRPSRRNEVGVEGGQRAGDEPAAGVQDEPGAGGDRGRCRRPGTARRRNQGAMRSTSPTPGAVLKFAT